MTFQQPLPFKLKICLWFSFLLLSACASNPLVTPVEIPQPQSAEAYINTQDNTPLMSVQDQREASNRFLEKYLTPWDTQRDFRYIDKARRVSLLSSQKAELRQL